MEDKTLEQKAVELLDKLERFADDRGMDAARAGIDVAGAALQAQALAQLFIGALLVAVSVFVMRHALRTERDKWGDLPVDGWARFVPAMIGGVLGIVIVLTANFVAIFAPDLAIILRVIK